MPRKTKKEKQARAIRRLSLQTTQTTSTDRSPVYPVKGEFTFSLKDLSEGYREAKLKKSSDKSAQITSTLLARADLVKSLILAALIFGVELVIYWARLKAALF